MCTGKPVNAEVEKSFKFVLLFTKNIYVEALLSKVATDNTKLVPPPKSELSIVIVFAVAYP